MNTLTLLIALQLPLVATEEAKLTASDMAIGDALGFSTAYDGDTAVLGATGADGFTSDTGAAYVYVRSGTTWTEQAKLFAADGAASDLFGFDVAIEGDTIVVGAPWDQDAGGQTGAAYAFVRNGTTWTEQGKLTASDAASGDQFGWSVAVHGDTALAGSPFDTHVFLSEGSAYVFTRNGTSWGEQAKLVASSADPVDFYGISVAVSGDTALVGAHGDDGIVTNSGTAYVYVRSGTSWSEQAVLMASDGDDGDQFGESVALDGDTAVLGAENDDDQALSAGAAYVFVRNGATWSEQGKLIASDGGDADNLGHSVSIDGDTAVLGAPGDDDSGPDAGAAYAFTRNGTTWTEQAKLVASDGAPGDEFGSAVAVAGAIGIAGAPNNLGMGAGYAHRFTGGPSTFYCTAGISNGGCQVLLGASGDASSSAPSGFTLFGQNAEATRMGTFIFSTSGRQALPFGNSSSYLCVLPPFHRVTVRSSVGLFGCGGGFTQDFNALWCPTCPRPHQNPGVGALVQAQVWYRDPFSSTGTTTVLSNAIEFAVAP